MANLFNDGGLPYGITPDTITINTVAYIPEAISIKPATKKIRQYNATGEPGKQALVPDFTDGTMTLQLASSSTAYPLAGMPFTADLLKEGSNQNYFLTSVEPVQGQDAARTLSVEFSRKIN